MAAEKSTPKKSSKAQRPAKGQRGGNAQSEKKNLVVIRGFVNWGEWLEQFAQSENMPATVLIDHCLREHAKKRGFIDPPPRF